MKLFKLLRHVVLQRVIEVQKYKSVVKIQETQSLNSTTTYYKYDPHSGGSWFLSSPWEHYEYYESGLFVQAHKKNIDATDLYSWCWMYVWWQRSAPDSGDDIMRMSDMFIQVLPALRTDPSGRYQPNTLVINTWWEGILGPKVVTEEMLCSTGGKKKRPAALHQIAAS